MFVLCDSGILLRLFHPSDPLHQVVRRSVDILTIRKDELVTAPQNAAEFWNVSTRPPSERGGFGLSNDEAKERLQAAERRFSVLKEPSDTYGIWRDLVIAHAVRGKQVRDARLVALMKANRITHIFTLNKPDFVRYPGIVILTPEDLLPPETPATP